jgi:glycosyltransferase involved in cell wall biosynthesis
MRIAFVSVSDGLGGSEIALVEMIAALRRARPDWPLSVILPGRGPLLERLSTAGASCHVVPIPDSLARAGESHVIDSGTPGRWASFGLSLLRVGAAMPAYERRLRQEIERISPRIVHSNGLKAHVIAARSARRIPLVWHMHEYVGRRPLTRALLRRHTGRTSAIIANSASVAADVEAALKPSRAVRVIHNAVNLAVFSPDGSWADLDTLSGLPPAATPMIRVGLVGTFARWKGHATFLRALARLPRGLPIRGYVIGAPIYETVGSQYSVVELKRLAAELGLAERVGFTGFLSAASALRSLDVVVHASTKPEPFGLVVAEAMACGRAVVVSAAGGATELFEPERDALAHAPGDETGLARCITRLASDSALRRKLGQHARQSAERRFDPTRLGRELVMLYDEVAGSRLNERCA